MHVNHDEVLFDLEQSARTLAPRRKEKLAHMQNGCYTKLQHCHSDRNSLHIDCKSEVRHAPSKHEVRTVGPQARKQLTQSPTCIHNLPHMHTFTHCFVLSPLVAAAFSAGQGTACASQAPRKVRRAPPPPWLHVSGIR